jgi:HD-like signal output (HDOD) protein
MNDIVAAPLHDAEQVSAESVRLYLNDKQAYYQRATTLHTMLANVPRLPPYTNKLASLLNDPKAKTLLIVEIARQDPSLTAAVLKTVNSPYYGLSRKVKDFQHAVIMLGFTQVQQLLMSVGVQSTMPDTLEFRQLHAHSMMISVLASEISLTLNAGSAPVLSTLGILHDIGRSLVLLFKRQFAKQDFLVSLLDPDMLGMLLLKDWQLPELIYETVQFQSYPELLPPNSIPARHRTNIAVLHLAHRCLERIRNQQALATPNPCPCRDYLAELECRDQSVDDFLFGRLLPDISSRNPVLPLALQDMLQKARSRSR